MKATFAKYIITAVSTVFILTACTERINIATGQSEEMLMVYAKLSNDRSDQNIILKRTKDYFDPEFKNDFLGGAEMKVYTESGKVYNMVELDSSPGTYSPYDDEGNAIAMEIEPGEILLEMTISEEIYPATAGDYLISETVPERVTLDSVVVENTKTLGLDSYNLYIYAQDPPGEKNYYCLWLKIEYAEGEPAYYYGNSIMKYILIDDFGVDGEYMEKRSIATYPSGKYNTSGTNMYSGIPYLSPSDRITVTMGSISEGYYKFLSQCQSVKNGTNPFFGGPLSNIYSNIPGGAGYFTGYCTSSATTVVPAAVNNCGDRPIKLFCTEI